MKNAIKKSSLLVAVLFVFLCVTSYAQQPVVTEFPELRLIINGDIVEVKDVPITVNNRTLIPLREILVSLGVPNDNDHIIWNDLEQSVTVVHLGKTVKLTVDSFDISINDKADKMDVCPVLYGERTYIPARFVAQSFDMMVGWEESTQTVSICSMENYNKVKDILTKNMQEFDKIEKYKLKITQKPSSVFDKTPILNETMSEEGKFDVNKKDQIFLGAYTLTEGSDKSAVEIYYSEDNFFIKDNSGNWMLSFMEDPDSLKQDLFNPIDFLTPTEYNCTSIAVVSENEAETLLRGEFIPLDFKTNDATFFSPENIVLEIKVNNKTGIITSVSLICDRKYLDFPSDAASDTYAYLVELTSINGSFAIVKPRIELTDYDRASAFLNAGNYEEAISLYKKIIKENPINIKLTVNSYYNMAIAQYLLDDYEGALDTLDKCLYYDDKYSDFYLWGAYCYLELEDYDNAIEKADKAIKCQSKNSSAHSAKGIALGKMFKFDEAMKCFDTAIVFDKDNANIYYDKLNTLYEMGNMEECIKLSKQYKEKFKDFPGFPFIEGFCYADEGEYVKAAAAMEEVILLDPNNIMAYTNAGWFYLYDNNSNPENIAKAESYVRKALLLDSENENALDLLEEVEQLKLPLNQQVVNFVQDHYLYIDEVENFEEKSQSFLSKSEVNSKDVAEFIEDIRLEDDMFTGTIIDEDYDEYMDYEDNTHIETKKLKDNTYYIGFDSFTRKTGLEFVEYIHSLENTENSTLIIDLRDNGGGSLDAACKMIDALLGKFETATLLDRDGVLQTYTSNEGKITFKKIYVFINEYSASASEMLVLALREGLDNVTVVGRPSFGKGVGQVTLENKEERIIIFLVDFYWNVMNKDVLNKHIIPDIMVEGDSLEDYLKAIGL